MSPFLPRGSMMATQIGKTRQDQEEVLLNIVRTLPQEHISQLIDFARFLETQTLAEEIKESETDEAEDAKWDALFASEEGQDLLAKLADEALEEHRAGNTCPIRCMD